MEVRIPIELIFSTIVTGVVGWLVKTMLDQLKEYRAESKEWRSNLDDKVDSINDATQATMRTTILHYCEKYLSRGWVTSEELSSLLDMHRKYSKLNDQNGFIDGFVTRVNNLDVHEI